MKFFFGSRRGWPTVALALAAGLLFADCFFVVGPYTSSFQAASLWPLLSGALATYALFGAVIDLGVQLLAGRSAGHSVWLRGGAILAVAASLCVAGGEARSLPLLAVAAIFALLVLGRFTWPIAALAGAVALYPLVGAQPTPDAVPSPAAPVSQSYRPSIVVVVLDTVRADHTSAYGYERDTTPNLARLADRGVRFERAYSTSHWSLPSHASLFTGLDVSHHGAHNEHLALDDRRATLAELLARQGYETVNFTANAWLGPGTGMSRGFDRTHEIWRRYHIDLMVLAKRIYFALAAPDHDKGGRETVSAISHWLAGRDTTRPYFLFVNVFEAHAPYQHVPRAFRTRWVDPDLSLREIERIGSRVTTATQNGHHLSRRDAAVGLDLLDGSIAWADAILGEILEQIGDEPIVVVVSDHGELFGEHTLYGHSNTLYEPLIRVPMIMAGGSLPRGRVVHRIVSLVDVMPTLLGLAGAEVPMVDGIDLRQLIRHPEGSGGRTIRAEQFSPDSLAHGWAQQRPEDVGYLHARKQAVVGERLKRIVSADGSDLAFDLAIDPGEERPFPGPETGLDAAAPEPEERETQPTLDPVQRKMLEVLGYLQ